MNDRIILTKDQKNIHDKVIEDIKESLIGDIFVDHSFISIIGAAGTGKTALTGEIVHTLVNDNKKIAILSPTHKALKVIRSNIFINNKNMHYATVHSFLGLKPKIDIKTGIQKFVKDKSKKASSLSKIRVDVMIVDESSFIGTELFEHIKKELLEYNRVKVVLFVGDEFQLLPVEDSNNLSEDSKEAKSAIFDKSSNIINHYKLTEVIRNGNTEVLDFYTEIRKMIPEKKTKSDLFNFLREETKKNHSKIHFYNSKKDFVSKYIEKERYKDESDVIVTFTNETVNNYNQAIRDYYIRKKYNEVQELTLDDLFVVQSSTEVFINSETIELKRFTEDEIDFKGKKFKGYVCTTSDGRQFNYISKESKDNYHNTLEVLKINALKEKSRELWELYYELAELFLDVKYVFSSTAHKAQGSSYENVFVDMTKINYVDNQTLLRLFYVAVTRSKNDVHILL